MDLATLDPEVAAAMQAVPARAECSAETLAEWRTTFPPRVAAPLSDEVERVDFAIRPLGPTVRVHRPKGVAEPLPALYWMHAGGLVLGNRLQDDQRFDSWCRRHRMIAASIDYRLAPETPYPGAIDDCYDGLRWFARHADELGIDPNRLGVGGASAGGGLAAAVALLARDRATVALSFQLLVYPMLDDRQCTPSQQVDLPVWSRTSNAFAWRAYLGDRVAGSDVVPYAAASRAEDLTRLPPAYVVVGGLDGFLDESIDYATRLAHAGVPTDLRVYPGLPHGFDGIAPGAEACKRASRDLNEWLSRAIQLRAPTHEGTGHGTPG